MDDEAIEMDPEVQEMTAHVRCLLQSVRALTDDIDSSVMALKSYTGSYTPVSTPLPSAPDRSTS